MTKPCGRPSSNASVATEPEANARSLATLRAYFGGLGLQSAELTSPAAYGAGMADTLPVIHARLPEFAERYRDARERGGDKAPSLRAAAEARVAASCVAQSQPTHPRQCDAARYDAGCPGAGKILIGAPRSVVADGHIRRASNDAHAAGHAAGAPPPPAYAAPDLPRQMRTDTWPWGTSRPTR
eukprot:s255_g19.t1